MSGAADVVTCRVCGAATAPDRAPVTQAEHGAVGVLVDGLSVRRCPDGHVMPALDDAVAVVGAQVRAQVLASASSGVLRRQRVCGACGAALTLPGRRTQRSVTVVTDQAPTFTVTLDLPMLRCPDCGLQQVPHEVFANDLDFALAGALLRPAPPPGG